MKTIEIVGGDYVGKWEWERPACRGVVLREGRLLLSYEVVSGLWMLPGGGREAGEEESACCVREVAEETGYLIRPSECVLQIDEYHRNWRMVNKYFFGTVIGQGERNLTEREAQAKMEPRWRTPEDMLAVFSRYPDYEETDRLRWMLYQRDFLALRALFGE